MTRSADAGVERARHVGRDRVAARGLDHEVRSRPAPRGRWRPPPGRPRTRTVSAALAGVGGHGLAQAAVAEDRDGVHVVGPSLRVVEGRPGPEDKQKAAVTVVVPRPLESPFPGGPGSSCRTRRLEPQGPCLPAGPPELLLRLLGEGVAVHVRTIRIFRTSCNHFLPGLRGLSRGGTHRRCPHPLVPDAGTPGQPAASAGRARARPRAGSAGHQRHRARRARRGDRGPCPRGPAGDGVAGRGGGRRGRHRRAGSRRRRDHGDTGRESDAPGDRRRDRPVPAPTPHRQPSRPSRRRVPASRRRPSRRSIGRTGIAPRSRPRSRPRP